jgi:uncharacterized membrane protein
MQNMSGGKTALGLDTNVGAMLCYLPICGISLIYSIIVLVTEKNNKFVRFCAFQSLLLTAAYVVVVVGVLIFGMIIAGVTQSFALGMLVNLLVLAVVVAFLAAMIFACVKAYGGNTLKLPVVGDMADKWA